MARRRNDVVVTEWDRQLPRLGSRCDQCGRYAAIYRPALNATHMRALRFACRHTLQHKPAEGWFKLGEEIVKATLQLKNYSELDYWGLLERQKLRIDGNPRGMWRVTPLGWSFWSGEASVPKWARTFDNSLIRLEGPEVFMEDAWQQKHDLEEVRVAGA